MKKVIRKKEYDTETATVVKKHTVGAFGDPTGYEETLYQTPRRLLLRVRLRRRRVPLRRGVHPVPGQDQGRSLDRGSRLIA